LNLKVNIFLTPGTESKRGLCVSNCNNPNLGDINVPYICI